MVAFPAVGVLVGVAWLGTLHLGLAIGTPLVAAVFVLVVDAALTGALHLDACGDVADGVASCRPPDEAVRIMREPTVGAVGAAVIALAALLRFALLADAVDAGLALVAAPVAGRTAMVVLLALLPARDESSLAGAFQQPGVMPTAAAGGFAALAAGMAGGLETLLALGVALLVVAGYAAWWRRRFGGLTGDGVGAGGLLAETAALLVLVG